MVRLLVAAVATLSLAPALPAERRNREQDAALDARKNGQALPLAQIERKILPRMAGFDYLGPEFDSRSSSYRLKFMRAGSVVWVDVDARTGAIIGRSGD